MKTAVFLGRFQPFHIGHMSIVEKIFSQNFEKLILIIGSAETSGTDENPWTLQEREAIIRASIPLELQEKMDILGLSDVPDDDEWCLNLQNLLGNFVNNEEGEELSKNQKLQFRNSCVLFTGNEWVRNICERHEMQTDWIDSYDIDISGTRIREMIKKGEDVSRWTNMN